MDSLTHVPPPGATKIYGLGRHTGFTSKFRLRRGEQLQSLEDWPRAEMIDRLLATDARQRRKP